MDQIIIKIQKDNANEKARDIYNLAYYDTPENRIHFEEELQKMSMENNYLLIAAMRALYIQTFRIATSVKPMEWAKRLLIQYKILQEFDR